MCTVSWLRRQGCYELFCNRDERHTRRPARAPMIQERCGVRFIAPVDGDHGGAWIGVNQFGLSLCLLNRYGDEQRRAGQRDESRGLLVNDLLDCLTSAQVYMRLRTCDLARYQPFTLLALLPGEPSLLVHWNGREHFIESYGEASMPLFSSAYQTAAVVAARRETFQRLTSATGTVTAELLHQFHRSHEPACGPHSVCMHRADAATVSFSHIKVNERQIEFVYQPQAPCAGLSPEVVVLPRARKAA
jgi:uncharacterized protein with NRDE domain